MTFTFRPMRLDDVPAVVAWQRSPAAERWFEPLTVEAATQRYGPWIATACPVRLVVAHVEGADIGYAQLYRIGDLPPVAAPPAQPDDVGIDFCIGSPVHLGRGLGAVLIDQLVELAGWAFPSTTGVVSAPDHRNVRSRRALRRAGFSESLWFDAPSPEGDTATLVLHRRPLP